MKELKEEFYVQKYTKGRSASMTQEYRIELEKLPILQKIFNIDPNHHNVLVRNMFTSHHISKKQAELLKPHVNFKFQFDKYTYSIDGGGKFVDDWTGNPIVERHYSACEYEKLIPWRFVEEYKLNVSLDFLRKIFKNSKYAQAKGS